MDFWNLIDEAIENLRARKCRPDVDNILGILIKKKCLITKDGLEHTLEQLEIQNKIYRYKFKGRISYRQTAQMTARHSGKLDEHGSCDNAGSYSSDTEEDSQPVKNGSGAELTIGEDTCGRTVSDQVTIEDRLKGLTQLSSAVGTSSDSDSPQERHKSEKKRSAEKSEIKSFEETKALSNLKRNASTNDMARVSGRKRIKKSHGPDFQTDILHIDCKLQLSTCAICQNKDHDRHLLQCSACKVYVHASCLQLTERSILKISANKQFFCLRCKPCKYCHIALETIQGLNDSANSLTKIIEGNDVVYCSHCYSVFHLNCIRPALNSKPKGTPWMCRRCTYEMNKRHRAKESIFPTAAETEAVTNEMSSSAIKANLKLEREKQRRDSKPRDLKTDSDGSLLQTSDINTRSTQGIRSAQINRQNCDTCSSAMDIQDNVQVPTIDRTSEKFGINGCMDSNNNDNGKCEVASSLKTEKCSGKKQSVGLKKVFVNDKDSELRKKLLESMLPSPGSINKKVAGSIDNNNNKTSKVDEDQVDRDAPWQQAVSESSESTCTIKTEVPLPDSLRFNNNLRCADQPPIVSENLHAFTPSISPVAGSSLGKSEKSFVSLPVYFDINSNDIGDHATSMTTPLPLRTVTPSIGSPHSSIGSDTDKPINTGTLAQFAIDYPDVSAWSAVKVADFFSDIGYVNEAKVFVEQEIDGASLLLLQRTDVLSILGLKLGPALKMFRHIHSLQDAAASY
ncbi:uncharacterized protein LOC111245325 [Varroa destructor]|uniref:Uncharacterized protein n=1 Tax=Varroa destructor TaxID=109461 RepID=A0A7M7JAR1_VARDE|nr:uncharacterized protein LOC111245325 [Varroa destructor]XP_022649279.1 uncharacterized protein LOC111245325 [Varroa destructor]XP_022649280.1 uncharacterized protein LOC111245325 [Varroa destructor]XP_022649282.1 uncharacterized protein LOC111245325 [Varroa destructor]XP_022649283.1 uncharacterized protein LOC111245325 [Varroa destructor]XP_022649284.1 uncharacterized protein LOC111245325 [Varroa destructor]